MEWEGPPPNLSGHVVICNASPEVRPLVGELHGESSRSRPDVVLVLQDEALWKEHPEWHPDVRNLHTRDHFFVVSAAGGPGHPDTLKAAGVPRAHAAVILADPRQGALADARSTLVAVAIEHLSARVHTVMELLSVVNRGLADATAVDEVVCVGELLEELVCQSCVTPGIKNVFQRLLSNDRSTNSFFLVRVPPVMVGFPFREVARRAIRAEVPFVLVGFMHAPSAVVGDAGALPTTSPSSRPSGAVVVLNPRAGVDPGKDTPLGPDDRLIVLAREPPELASYLGALDFVMKGGAVATPMF